MNITPDQARELLDGATPGPWEVKYDNDVIETATTTVLCNTDGALEWGYNTKRDVPLAAAAPDLAQTVIDQAATIAGMTEEWGVAHDGNVICLDFYGTEAEEPGHQRWTESRTRAEKWAAYMRGVFPGETYHIARRTVGPVEVIDGE